MLPATKEESDNLIARLAEEKGFIFLHDVIPDGETHHIFDSSLIKVYFTSSGYEIHIDVHNVYSEVKHYICPILLCPTRYTAAQRKEAAMQVFRNTDGPIPEREVSADTGSAEFSAAVDAIIADSFFRLR